MVALINVSLVLLSDGAMCVTQNSLGKGGVRDSFKINQSQNFLTLRMSIKHRRITCFLSSTSFIYKTFSSNNVV